MSRASNFAVVVAVLAIVLLGTTAFSDPVPDSPAATVKNYYLAIGTNDLSKIRSFYSTEMEQFFASQPPERRAAMESGKTVTFGDTITGVDVKNQTQQGDKVWVTVAIHYKKHEDANFNAGVLKENGVWKLGLN
jgi:diaminopimelate decarboxylase